MALKRKKPTVLKKLSGEKRPSRLNEGEPEPETGISVTFRKIKPTQDVRKLRRAYLKYFEEVLSDMKVLTVADSKQLEIYCNACADEVIYREILLEEGLFFEIIKMDSMGNQITEIKSHPATVRLEKARDSINRYGAVLGLTPSARASLQVISKEPEGKFAKFINGNKKKSK